MGLRSRLMAGAGAAAAIFVACHATAAAPLETASPSADQPVTTVHPVMVTARRVEEDVQKIPVAVTVVNSAALEDRHIRVFEDLKTALPSIQIASSPDNPSGPTIELRGQGEPDDVITTDPAVGIYLDGVYIPRDNGLNYILEDSEEIGQVEVLRGPQGTLFGRNTTGGAFNIVSKTPTPEFGGYGRAIVGDYGLWDLAAGVNAPLSQGTALRLSYEHGEHGGYGRDSIGAPLASERFDFVHGRLTSELGDRLTIDASANYLNFSQGEAVVKFVGFNPASLASPDPMLAQEAQGVIGDVLIESGILPIPQNIPQGIGILQSFAGGSLYRTGGAQDNVPNTGDFWNGALTLTYKLDDAVTLKSITGYVQTHRSGQLDLDATPFQLITAGDFTSSKAWSEELQALFKAGAVDGVAGAYYFDETGEDATFAAALPLLQEMQGLPPLVVFDGVADNRSWALYGQANWRATDRLTLTAGVRYTWDSKGLRSFNHAGDTETRQFVVPTDPGTGLSTDPASECLIALNLQNVAPGLCEAHLTNNYAALTWTGSASYQVTPDVQAYAKASRGYRGGGENLRGGSITFSPFGPEYATQYEVGAKSTFWDRRAQLNAAAYYTDYSNIQLTNIVQVVVNGEPITGTTISNAGKAHLEGVEVESAVSPIPRLTLGLTADWFHGKYTRYTYAGIDETTQPWGTPAYTVDLLARYEIPLAFGSIAAQADYDWRDRATLSLGDITDCTPVGQACVYNAAREVVTGPTVGLLSARVTLHLEAWKTDISLWGRNLTNDRYFLSELGPIDARIFNVGFVSDPLTFGVELRKGF